MTSYGVFASILDQGLQTTHYFNGRSLLKSDFDRDQAATTARALRLGRVLGSGVAEGLFVSFAPTSSTIPTLRIQPGMAINRAGQTLVLPMQIDLTLANSKATASVPSTSSVPVTFEACTPPSAATYLAGAGIYLVTIAPAYGTRDTAPAGGLPGMTAPCNVNVDVEGVMFHRIPIELPFDLLNDRAHLRNRLAYEFFGVSESRDDTLAFAIDPFGTGTPTSLIDMLHQTILGDCEVPLALFHWTATEGVTFLDQWSVRRRVAPNSMLGAYGELLAERRRIDGEARFLQFQEQLADLRRQGALLTEAQQTFDYLPAAGILPVVDMAGLVGFQRAVFFRNMTMCEPVYIDAARAEALLRSSLEYPPIDVAGDVAVRLYGVRQSAQQYEASTGQRTEPYFIFASGYMPSVGDAYFDVSRFDFSNFSAPI